MRVGQLLAARRRETGPEPMKGLMAERRAERSMKLSLGKVGERRLSAPALVVIAAGSLAVSLVLAGCENVAGYTATSLVRLIDASYNAPAINVYVQDTELAANSGQGTITKYGTFSPSNNATVKVTNASNDTTLVNSNGTLLPGKSQSVLVTDINATYQVSVLEDHATAAPSGHSDFRVLNQAPSTGAIDIYFLSSTTAASYATAKPVITALAVGATSGYVAIPSSTLFMVIAPAGTTLTTTATNIYVSASQALVGGEVRTVLVVDPLLVTQPVQVYIANDVN